MSVFIYGFHVLAVARNLTDLDLVDDPSSTCDRSPLPMPCRALSADAARRIQDLGASHCVMSVCGAGAVRSARPDQSDQVTSSRAMTCEAWRQRALDTET